MSMRQPHAQRIVKRKGKERPRVQFQSESPGRTKQEFTDECNINHVMGRARALKRLQDPTLVNTNFGDATGYDFHEAMNFVVAAQQQFEQLPSDLRNRFNNDPGQLLTFLEDPENREEARKLGIVNAETPKIVTDEKTPDKPAQKTPESKAEPSEDKTE